MALAIKKFTAEQAYKDVTLRFTDAGRTGAIVHCPDCGEEHLLYYGPEMTEGEAIAWLEDTLRKLHPDHRGWLSHDEKIPFSNEDHRRRIEDAIGDLQRQVQVEQEAAQRTLGEERNRLIGSYSRKQGKIRELTEEL